MIDQMLRLMEKLTCGLYWLIDSLIDPARLAVDEYRDTHKLYVIDMNCFTCLDGDLSSCWPKSGRKVSNESSDFAVFTTLSGDCHASNSF